MHVVRKFIKNKNFLNMPFHSKKNIITIFPCNNATYHLFQPS